MIEIPENIKKILKDIFDKTSPVSIFLYGSRARTDFLKTSDYEIGILYKSDKKVSRSDLAMMHDIADLRIYPFDHDEFINNKIDTPFPKAVYMRGLVARAKTIFGEKVVENMKLPEILLLDLFEESIFQISRAYTAMLSEREGDIVSAKAGFVKSVLYGTLVLVVLKLKEFPVGYDETIKLSNKLVLNVEHTNLINHAYEVRNGAELQVPMIYKSMSYINKEVIDVIRTELKNGNKKVL